MDGRVVASFQKDKSNNSLSYSVLNIRLWLCQAALPTVAGSHIQNNRELAPPHSSAFVEPDTVPYCGPTVAWLTGCTGAGEKTLVHMSAH